MKTEANLQVIRQLPLENILVETGLKFRKKNKFDSKTDFSLEDAPWCGIKASHASFSHVRTNWNSDTVKKEKWAPGKMVKDRNEPCAIM